MDEWTNERMNEWTIIIMPFLLLWVSFNTKEMLLFQQFATVITTVADTVVCDYVRRSSLRRTGETC